MTDSAPSVPQCGSSDLRNVEYEKNFTSKKFFDALVSSDSPTIFDVGAHKGESVLFFKHIYPTASIYSFEPEPSNFEALSLVARTHKSLAFNLAIGDSDETVDFYRQSLSHLGGLVPINKDSTDSLGYAAKAKNEKIKIRKIRLDTFVKENNVVHIDVLKIDVQGFEVGVLQGSLEALKLTDCVTVEISLYDFYRNERYSFLKVEQLMALAGFCLWDFSKVSKNPKNLRTDWVEVVYRKII